MLWNIDEPVSLDKVNEFIDPKPASVVPNIPVDAKQQMGTVDKMAQVIIPKLVDRLNEANWKIARLERVCEILIADAVSQDTQVQNMYNWQVNATEIINKLNAPRTRKKKDKPVAVVVPVEDIAEEVDGKWVAKTIADHRVTGALIGAVEALGEAAPQMYPEELVEFIDFLTDDMKAAIRQRFPN